MENKLTPKVAFLIHPMNIYDFIKFDIKNFYPNLVPYLNILKKIPVFSLKYFFTKIPIHKFLEIEKINFINPIGILGITFPFFPDQIISFKHSFVLKKLIDACNYAYSLGAKIVVLGGFTSIICDEGRELLGKTKVMVTSGNTYTAALCLDGINKAANMLEKPIENSNVLIIGATGDIGSICAKILAKKAKTLILCSRKINIESNLVKNLKANSNVKLIIESNVKSAVRDADIILTATSALMPIIDIADIKKGAIICDVSLPPNIPKESLERRKDVFVFNGGKAKLRNVVIQNDKWQKLMPQNSIYGCLAEGLILCIEKRFENYSIGRGSISEDKVEELLILGRKNGIILADFTFHEKIYSLQDINLIKQECDN